MLSYLNIKNYALIEDIEIDLSSGLTTITGETGAGKSIILGAIGLLTGNRADRSMLKNAEKKCIIEASFNLSNLNLETLFEEHDIDYSVETIIRREFSKDGKSRVFINDSPVALLHLKEVMNHLLDVHSQHENLQLNNRQFQLNSIDIMAGNTKLKKAYIKAYNTFQDASDYLSKLTNDSQQLRENTELLTHQLNELSDADLKVDEQEELENELDTLNHAEEIKINFQGIDQLFNESDSNPIQTLHQVQSIIRKTKSHFNEMESLNERMESLMIELEDIRSELEKHSENFTYDPERLQIVQDRISLLFQLQQKYKVNTVQELIEKMESFRLELSDIESLDDRLDEARKRHELALSNLTELANELTESRKGISKKIEENILSYLKQLGMTNSQLNIQLDKKDFGPDGQDEVEYLFSANKGIDTKPLGKVASGGEMSRLMLSIKAMLTSKIELPTIIFDEIDTGISGLIAEKMGKIIREMCGSTQVLAITHLPQIAAMGNQHMVVYKDESGEKSKTKIKLLQEEERINEIARLLSGEQISTEALNNAKVLLSSSS